MLATRGGALLPLPGEHFCFTLDPFNAIHQTKLETHLFSFDLRKTRQPVQQGLLVLSNALQLELVLDT